MTMMTALESMEVTVPPTLVVRLDVRTGSNPDEMAAAMGTAMRTLRAFLVRNAIATVGPVRAIYTAWGPTETRFTVAVPIGDVPVGLEESDGVTLGAIPEATALRFVHRGPYRELRDTYERIEAWLRERGGIRTAADWQRYAPMWEEYLNDPSTTPESELITRIYLTLP